MEETDLIIVGGGPGGLSASIYGVRNGLSTLVLEKGMCGGLVGEAPWVENYLGYPGKKGMELVELFKEHASRYATIHELEDVLDIERSDDRFHIITDKERYVTRALILATGSRHSKLGVEGEEELAGKGVSYCATCDGYFFRNKQILVVGGGNTAVMDAIHLHDIGCSVKLIHRKDELRAECSLKDILKERGIEVIWNSEVIRILGSNVTTGVLIRDNVDGGTRQMDLDGVFISIGEVPNNHLAMKIGVELDEKGYVRTDKFQRTNIDRVYAVGDIGGGVKQIIVACGEGAVAALAAYEDLIKPYWYTCRVPDSSGKIDRRD